MVLNRHLCLWLILFASVFSSCTPESVEEVVEAKEPQVGQDLFVLLSPEQSGITFRNDLAESANFNPSYYLYAYNGGGVAIGDLDNDGMDDIVLTSNQKGAKIYKNMSSMMFKDMTGNSGIWETQGWMTGVTLADINMDGLLDIYICRSGLDTAQDNNLLYINKGDWRFEEKAAEYGLLGDASTTHAAFFDMDRDGDLDAYILNHPIQFYHYMNLLPYKDKKNFADGRDQLLENRDGKFIDITEKAGIVDEFGFGLSVSIADVNGDLWPDIFVANDFLSPDKLYINKGNGRFVDETAERLSSSSFFSMGSDFGDINNDGWQDLLVVDMMPRGPYRQKKTNLGLPIFLYSELHNTYAPSQFEKNAMHLNLGGGYFQEIADLLDVAKTDWSWTALLADFDNNGWTDIYISNGTKRDYNDLDYMKLEVSKANGDVGYMYGEDTIYKNMPVNKFRNYLFLNMGNMQFVDATVAAGLGQEVVTGGGAYGDLDNDGDLDLVINNTDTFAFVYQNITDGKKNGISISMAGKEPIGCKATIYTDKGIQVREVSSTAGFQSTSSFRMHYGLGDVTRIDSIVAVWPNGSKEVITNTPLTGQVSFKSTYAKDVATPVNIPKSALFTENELIAHKNIEGPFIDFRRDRLLPFMLSKEGPAFTMADVDGNGLEDVFIGGAIGGSKPMLYLQKAAGKFTSAPYQPWQEIEAENMDALFLDFNGDGWPDLYLANGSNEANSAEQLKDRVFINKGGKGFEYADGYLPQMPAVAKSKVLPIDIDGDGDMDLFIGGRLLPGQYPKKVGSFILQNDNGVFTDITASVAGQLASLGTVTDAVATDFDKDGLTDLVVVGDWQSVMFFKNTGGRLQQMKNTGVEDVLGLWSSIEAADLDNDGLMDFVVGNNGLNSFYKASAKQPMTLYYNDFDGNGTYEPVTATYQLDTLSLCYARDVIGSQMPKLRTRFHTHDAYASASISDILGAEKLKEAETFKVTQLASGILHNMGNGQWEFQPLPFEAQVSTIYAIVPHDFNNDGHLDLLLGGNTDRERYDLGQHPKASPGVVLLGDGKMGFKALPQLQTGLRLNGLVRHMMLMEVNGRKTLFVANSNGKLQTLTLNGWKP